VHATIVIEPSLIPPNASKVKLVYTGTKTTVSIKKDIPASVLNQLTITGEVEVIEEPKPERSLFCPKETCVVVSEECLGDDLVQVLECITYVKRNNTCEKEIYNPSKIIKNGCPAKEIEIRCNGCYLPDDRCLPIGSRIKSDDTPYFCDIDKLLKKQKEDGESCDNSFECKTNFCSKGICYDIQKEIEKTRGLLEKIILWFKKLFGWF
jgi:hypothetical protein